eukprot:scaffold166853_cov50-Attheya_sp.AAC.2
MSTISLHVESIAGPPMVTNPYLFVAWSNSISEDKDNFVSWKKAAKSPMRADPSAKKPPRRQLSRAPASDESSYEENKMDKKLPSKKSAKAPMRADPDASDKSSDDEDKMDKKLPSKKSAKAPIRADPDASDESSDDEDKMDK